VQKNHLEYLVGTTTFRLDIGVGSRGPTGESRALKVRAALVKGSKPQVLLGARAYGATLLSGRNVNESLLLRLNTYARNEGLFRQAE